MPPKNRPVDLILFPAEEPMESRLRREGLIPLTEAAALYPRRRGRLRHPSTVYRHITEGVTVEGRAVCLEALRLPDGWMTTRQAIERFWACLTTAATASLRARRHRLARPATIHGESA